MLFACLQPRHVLSKEFKNGNFQSEFNCDSSSGAELIAVDNFDFFASVEIEGGSNSNTFSLITRLMIDLVIVHGNF